MDVICTFVGSRGPYANELSPADQKLFDLYFPPSVPRVVVVASSIGNDMAQIEGYDGDGGRQLYVATLPTKDALLALQWMDRTRVQSWVKSAAASEVKGPNPPTPPGPGGGDGPFNVAARAHGSTLQLMQEASGVATARLRPTLR